MTRETPESVTLSDLVKRNQFLDVRCTECGVSTPIDPDFFLTRRGDIAINELKADLVCAGCGSSAIKLETVPAKPA